MCILILDVVSSRLSDLGMMGHIWEVSLIKHWWPKSISTWKCAKKDCGTQDGRSLHKLKFRFTKLRASQDFRS